jgi:hypothetical protein
MPLGGDTVGYTRLPKDSGDEEEEREGTVSETTFPSSSLPSSSLKRAPSPLPATAREPPLPPTAAAGGDGNDEREAEGDEVEVEVRRPRSSLTAFALQVAPSLLLSGVGMLGAGALLDIVQVS